MKKEKACRDCKHFGRNLDKGNIEYCWDMLGQVKSSYAACIIFEPRQKIRWRG